MWNIESAIQKMNQLMGQIPLPKDVLPASLLWCTTIKRSGGSPMSCASDIIAGLAEDGFKTGKNTDGSSNMQNKFVYAIVRGMYNMMVNHMVTDISIPIGGIQITGTSPTGPIQGTNVNFVLGRGRTH